jgi:hypothetical protein
VELPVLLSIQDLVQKGIIGPHLTHGGTLAWSSRGGSPPYKTQIRVETEARDGWLTLSRAGTKQRIRAFCPDPQPLRGLLWAYECPRSSAPSRLLYLPPFELEFACRQSHRIGYASQTPGRLGCVAALWKAPRFLPAAPRDAECADSTDAA